MQLTRQLSLASNAEMVLFPEQNSVMMVIVLSLAVMPQLASGKLDTLATIQGLDQTQQIQRLCHVKSAEME